MSDREERGRVRRRRPATARRLVEVDEIEVEVERLVAGGEGLARFGGIPIFVPRSAPGDRLRVRLVERKPDYGRAEIVEILEAGPGRRQPPCPFFDRCGGCDLQHLEDDLQPRLKAAAVVETLVRLGGIELSRPPEVVAGAPWGYRLRTQLKARPAPDGGMEVGYFARGSHDLVAVDRCPILVPELEELLPRLPVLLDERATRLDLTAGDRGTVASAPVVPGLPHGEVSLTVAGIELSYDARVFFQAHRGLLGALIERVVGEETGETAYDLYSGVGLFSLPLARRYERVVAVEADRIAARYCRNNARRNKLPGVETVNRSVESWVEELPRDAPRVVVDPPRSGLPAVVRRTLTARPPRRLTYVSCHAATLARDLKALTRRFTLDELTLFDLFPQTGHMEAVVQMTRVEREDAG